MKQLIYKFFSLLMLLLLSNQLILAAEITKERKINKTFQVRKDTRLKVSNQFGKVHINTNGKKEFTVEILIQVTQPNEERALEILDKIEVEFDEGRDEVAISTILNNVNSKNGRFSIDYLVTIPADNPVDIKNQFGDVYLGDTKGLTKLDVSYGNLVAETIDNDAEIVLSFGSGGSTIGSLNNGDLTIKYSNLELNQASQLKLDNQFSKVTIGEIDQLEVTCNYGGLEVEKATSITGEVKFSDFELDKLVENLDLRLSYSKNFSIREVDPGYKNIIIDANFSSINLTVPPKSASLSASLQFGKFNYHDEEVKMSEIDKDHTSSNFKGQVGNGNTNSSIDLEAKYGNINLRVK